MMRLRGPHVSNRGRELDDEVIDLTDRLAPYASSAWRVPQQESAVEPAPAPSFLAEARVLPPLSLHPAPPHRTWRREPAEADADCSEPTRVEPETLDPVAELVVDEPEALDAELAELVVDEPEALDAVLAELVVDEPEALDAVLAELVRDEAEALEAAMNPMEAERGSRTTASKQSRNEPCACGSGRKYKRCCGQRPEVP